MNKQIQYQKLDATRITDTIFVLSNRVNERFPDSGLYRVSQKLLDIAQRGEAQANWIDNPIIGLRIGVGFLIILIFVALAGTLSSVGTSIRGSDRVYSGAGGRNQ